MSLNRIDDLLNTTIHSSGRREDRQTFRFKEGYFVPRKDGKPGTDPIKRAKPKRDGLTKKQFKKLKREQHGAEKDTTH